VRPPDGAELRLRVAGARQQPDVRAEAPRPEAGGRHRAPPAAAAPGPALLLPGAAPAARAARGQRPEAVLRDPAHTPGALARLPRVSVRVPLLLLRHPA
ncbi:unnamed protein product, partial [Prorocentrum cordatum]